ncbi:hydrolase [Gordonia phage DumpsterDude]|uniref:Hydrolase n=1 Tax=Gordonia phage DumpsterDude TaxID=2713262 RepID=A0A6G8R084_9CAUD|nr:SGNH/GDSL hydrolase family protein [Gordonia phage DumpsterDude]QIN93619.1 hydrolase [Gordonia phage DumpsterDude]
MGILDVPAHSSRGMNTHLHNFSAKNFRKTAAALARVRNGDGDMRLLCAGDSTTAGAKASTAATYVGQKAYPRRLAELLNTYMVPAAPGLAAPRGTSSAITADTRWTAGAGWAMNGWTNAYCGFGGKGANFRGTGVTGGALTFQEPGVLADTFDVYYRRAPSSGTAGTFSVQATGGSVVNGDAAAVGGAPRLDKVTVTAGSAATTNVVTILGLTAAKNVEITHIVPRLSTMSQVLVGNAGISGSTTTDWVTYSSNSTANDFGGLGAIKSYAPDLTILDLGINDANALVSPAADYVSRLQQIIAAAKVSGDVILKTMMPTAASVAPATAALEAEYVAAVKGLGVPVIDYYSRTAPGNDYLAGGMLNADGIHGTDFGYLDVASVVFEALRAF